MTKSIDSRGKVFRDPARSTHNLPTEAELNYIINYRLGRNSEGEEE